MDWGSHIVPALWGAVAGVGCTQWDRAAAAAHLQQGSCGVVKLPA